MRTIIIVAGIAGIVFLSIGLFGGGSNNSNTEPTCWMCKKPATHRFGTHDYCDKHYADAIAGTMMMIDEQNN